MVWIWAGLILFVLLMLALDLGVFHRKAHVVTLGLSFSICVYHGYQNRWMGLGSAVDAVDGVINDGATAMVSDTSSWRSPWC